MPATLTLCSRSETHLPRSLAVRYARHAHFVRSQNHLFAQLKPPAAPTLLSDDQTPFRSHITLPSIKNIHCLFNACIRCRFQIHKNTLEYKIARACDI
jgi:hypothetical protein